MIGCAKVCAKCGKEFTTNIDRENIEYVLYGFLVCGFPPSYKVHAGKVYEVEESSLLCSDCMIDYVKDKKTK
jgi:hypothetical protein